MFRARPPSTQIPAAWPWLGHLPAFYLDKLGFLDRCARSSQPAIRLRIGGPTLLLRDPGDIRYVLQDGASNFAKSPIIAGDRGQRMLGQGVLTSSGDRHRRLRAALQPIFARQSALNFVPAIHETVREITSSWRTGDIRDLTTEMTEIAEAVASRLLFGPNYQCQCPNLIGAFRIRRTYFQFRFDFPFSWAEWLPVPLQFRYRDAMRTIRAYVAARIGAARERPDSSCLLNLMATSSLTDEELLDEVIALGITGYEPVGEGLVWAMWLIANHPDVQAEVHREAIQYFQSGDSAFSSLPYTWAVLQESMRLYPPTWLFLRYTKEPVSLPSGISLPSGTKIYISPWVVHRDARFFEEPLHFQPERFLPGASKHRPPLAYLPFGAGSRMCLGMHFAQLEGTLALASLIRDFEIIPVTAGPIRPKPRITLRAAGPVRVRLGRRP